MVFTDTVIVNYNSFSLSPVAPLSVSRVSILVTESGLD